MQVFPPAQMSESAATEEGKPTTLHNLSRPSSVNSSLGGEQQRISRVFSAQHFDDSSHYHAANERVNADPEKQSDEGSSSSEISEKIDQAEGERESTVNERDVEVPLEKIKSSKSVHDPNLV